MLPSVALLQKLFLSFQAFRILEDITVIVVPNWQREMLLQAASAKLAVYVTEVFKYIVTEQHICEWSGLVSYRGGLGKCTIPQNVTTYLEFLLQEKFAAISTQDWLRIHEGMNRMLC